MARLADETAKLSELAIAHDAEMEEFRAAVPGIRTELTAVLETKVAALIASESERAKAELSVRQGILARDVGVTAQYELLAKTESIRSELVTLAERSLSALLVEHERKVSEIRPRLLELAKETALAVTHEFAQKQTTIPDIIRKELAALPPVGVSLVRANKGNWKPDVVYHEGDIIAFRGSSYLVLRTTVRGEFPGVKNQQPPNPIYQILAAAGSPGPRGTIADLAGLAVTSVAGTTGQVLVNGATAAATGAVTLSLPTAITGVNSLTSATGQALTLATLDTNQNVVISPNGTGITSIVGAAQISTGLGVGAAAIPATAAIYSLVTINDSYIAEMQNNTAAQAANIILRRAHAGGTTISTGDRMGQIVFRGYDGAAYTNCVFVRAEAMGTISSGVVPGRLLFITSTAAGAQGTALTIDSSQQVSIAATTDSTSTTTGAEIIAGGLGVAKAAFFGGPVVFKNYTVATLPAAATYSYGMAFVTDATLTAITGLGLAPTGGGGNKVPVYSDGTSWLML